ncbi:MAG: hypothetical protein A2X22_06700 [Bacteroidetes bacterium GWF2_49_14]|nr:MAG: hypothetical protein A2X22_06700 [Bacteroidetes bacterium GWF2_49_14]HBB92220.1 hypothetical protein [Bacteroidales bacterium]
MRRSLSTLFLIFLPMLIQIQAQIPQLSATSRIDLVTCGPGKEIFTYFGHSALRVYDPVNRIDKVYNYGTFDFNVPNFYWQFVKGKLYYMLSVSRFDSFVNEYIRDNRFVRLVPLALTDTDRQELFNLLEINNLPENRHYWYDFFLDNCSTRVRDIVLKATQNGYPVPVTEAKTLTFRQLINPHLTPNPWPRAGMMLLLAGGADRQATISDYMFLPEQMERLFLQMKSASGQNLAGQAKTVFEPDPKKKKSLITHPYIVFSFLTLISLFLAFYPKRARLAKTWFSILFFLSGIMGILFAFMWVGSDHWVCKGNLNLAWAFPLTLFLAITLWIPGLRKINQVYSRIMMIPVLFFLITFPFWKQSIPLEGILLAVSLGAGFCRFSAFPGLTKSQPQNQAN